MQKQQRRRFLQFIGISSLGGLLISSGVSGCSSAVPEFWDIAHDDLIAALDTQFPKNYPIAGLLQASLARPELEFLPQSNRLRALMQVAFSGASLGRTFIGSSKMSFGLRFERQDYSLRATELEVEHLSLEGAAPAIADMLSAYGPYIAEKLLQSWVLYQLELQQREQLQRWGVLPAEAIQITPEAIRVRLEKTLKAP